MTDRLFQGILLQQRKSCNFLKMRSRIGLQEEEGYYTFPEMIWKNVRK